MGSGSGEAGECAPIGVTWGRGCVASQGANEGERPSELSNSGHKQTSLFPLRSILSIFSPLLPSPLSIPPPLTPHYPLSPPAKLLVAEKSKGIRFYDMNTEVPIMTLDVWSPAHQLGPPLLSVDWSPSNNLVVGGVANGYWAIWDVAQSR